MKNCIFSSSCSEEICDNACPAFVETTYLMERNGIKISQPVLHISPKNRDKTYKFLDEVQGTLHTVITSDTIDTSTLITYCAICKNWHGNRLHCDVYHLKFSNHIDSIQQSWAVKDTPESLEYEQIWIARAKILIISNLDFVQFKDFQAQTLLNIIHNRMNEGLTTIVVCPNLGNLVGSGVFFQRLISMFREVATKW